MTHLNYRTSSFDYAGRFFGNPNRTITAIDVSGGITCSRTSGQTPCFIQASASAITATGTDLPWEDLNYTWDFGDTASTETFTNPGVGGGTVNSNTSQRGPEAVHCYRSAGTYTITLRIWGKNSSGGYTSRTTTQSITVTAYSASGGEYWVDSVAGSDSNDGLSIGAPKQTITAINSILTGASQLALHIKCGSSFDGATGMNPWIVSSSRTGLRIDSYGTGAKPYINVSSGTNYPFRMTNGGSSSPRPKADVVISGIRFSNSGTNTAIAIVSVAANDPPTAALEYIYFDNCEAHLGADTTATTTVSFSLYGIQITGTGAWNCVATCDQVRANSTMGYLSSVWAWWFVLGGSVSGGTGLATSNYDHHIYPDVRYHSLHRWIDFQQGTNRSYCINLAWTPHGVVLPEYAEFHLIADCGVTGVMRFHDASSSDNSVAKTKFKNLISERCRVHDLTGDGVIYFFCAETYTMRDHEIWGCVGGSFFSLDVAQQGSVLKTKAYRNKHHRPATAVTGNIFSFPSASWTLLQEMTDNITVDLRTAAQIAAFPFTQQAGATFDRNQYYAPNDASTSYLYDVTTVKTFAQWQAAGFDTNGSVADPGWTNGAIGDFS